MTILQINLIVEAASRNSVSAAAEKLGIAQSNASQTIKKLEEELGFSIFKRNFNGISLTEEGYRFLEEAEKILHAEKAIHLIASEEKITRLHVGVINYTPASEAFIKFCMETRDAALGDLVCVNIDAEEGAQKLKERSLDIVVTVLTKESLQKVNRLCHDYRLKCFSLRQIPVVVRLRKDHPLLLNNSLDGSMESFMQLKDYPFVEYSSLNHRQTFPTDPDNLPFRCSYIISVDERQTRLQTVAATNGYSIGCPTLQSYTETYGLAEIPIKGESLELVYIVRNGDEDTSNIQKYIQLLENEVNEIMSRMQSNSL